MIYLLILLGFLFFAGLAMTINEGLWSNTILLVCIMTSGLIAAVGGVPLGTMILEQADQDDANAWYFVFAGMWAAFALTLLIMRIIVDKASQTRVRFLPVLDKIGGMLMGLTVAVMLTGFAAFTLLNGPIEAGESDWWKDASDAQKSYFQKAATPFHSVYKSFRDAEKLDSSFFD